MMSSSIWRNWLHGAILVPCLTGCQAFFGSAGAPHDPLFLSKTPVSAKAELTPPVAYAYLEPALPRDPFLAKNQPVIVEKKDRSIPGTLTNRGSERE